MRDAKTTQKLIVVLGMRRSGTSAITRGLKVVRVELGDRLLPSDPDNAGGFWEDVDIVAFNEELLAACNCSWHSIDAIQPVDAEFLCDRGYLIKAIEMLRSKVLGHERFGFKDPRTAKMMPFWAKVFESVGYEVCYVFALRNPLSIVKSLASRNHFEPEKSYLLWVNHILECLPHVGGRECIIFDYDCLMRNSESELSRLASWIGADLDLKELAVYCRELLDERLRHSQIIYDDVCLDQQAPALVKEIYNFLVDVLNGNAGIGDAATSGRLKQWISEFDRLRPIIRLIDKQDILLQAQTMEVQRLAQEKMELATQYDALVRSSSWRITRPLRVAVALARGNPIDAAHLGKVPGMRIAAFPFVWAGMQLGRAQRTANLALRLSQRAGGTGPLFRGGMQVLRQQGVRGIRSKLRQLEAGNALTPLKPREGTEAIARDHFHSLVAARFPNLSALPVYATPGKERRITVVTDSIASGSLYGGVGTALIFAALAAERIGCALRVVTRTEAGDTTAIANILNASGINWNENIEIIHAPYYTDKYSRGISASAGDFFLTTSWWTTWATQLSVVRSRIAYIVQEDERMFYPYGDEHLRCSEMLSSQDFFYIVNSNLLLRHFQNHNLMLKATTFEPSFPSSLYHVPEKSERVIGPKRRFFFYARPNNARNLYYRGLETVASSIENGILDPKEWDFYFVGHDSKSPLLPNGVRPIIPGVMTWDKYAAFVRSMDLGLSLMYTPHPSYPPLDLAASGSVVVTNRFGIKHELNQYSNNILCSDSDLLSLTETMRKAVDLSKDHKLRYRNYAQSGLQRDWSISMASALDKFVSWIQA